MPSSLSPVSSKREPDVPDDQSNALVIASHPSAAVWAKMDLVVLPMIAMMYFLASLDRTNIGNARIAGFQQDLHISNSQYSFALTLSLIPYVLVEVPSNALMMRVGPRLLLPTLVTLWGVASALQGIVQNYSGLLACRFFLGLLEGGLPPGMYFYLSSFYPRRMLQLRISVVFSATSFASAFSGLLAAAVLHMDGIGGRRGWAWLFILEGLLAVLFGLISYFILPDSPMDVQTLTHEEKEMVSQILLDEGIIKMKGHSPDRSWAEFLRTFTQPHAMILAFSGFFNGTTVGSLSYYLPSIVASLGFSGTKAQLTSVPPFAVSGVLSVITAILADRYGHRGATLIFFSLMSTAGFAVFLSSFDNHVRYGSLFLFVSGTYCAGPPPLAWIANNVAPSIRRATALALFTVFANSGAILSTWLFGALSPPPRYRSATIVLLTFQVCLLSCAVLALLYLAKENRRKAAERLRTKRSPVMHGEEHHNESIWFEYVM